MTRLFIFLLLAFITACSDSTESKGRALDLTDSRELVIQPKGGSEFQLVRATSQESSVTLDPEKTNIVFREIGRLNLESGFEVSLDNLGEYGLEEPELVVRVAGLKEKKTIVSFGSYSSFSGKRYVRIDKESTVHLTGEDLFQSLNKQQIYFVDDTLVDFVANDMCRIEFSIDGDTRTFKKQGTVWEEHALELPRPLEEAQIKMFLKTLTMFKSKKSVSTPLEDSMLRYQFSIYNCQEDNPAISVKLSGLRKDAFDIEGGPLYIQSSQRTNTTFVIERTAAPILNPQAMSFQRQYPFTHSIEEVYEAQFLHANDPRVYRRAGETWLVNEKEGDRPFVEASIKSLLQLQAVHYVRSASMRDSITRETPLIDFRLLDVRKKTILAGKLWWDREQNKFFGKDVAYGEVFEVNPVQVKKVFPEKRSLYPVVSENSISRSSIG